MLVTARPGDAWRLLAAAVVLLLTTGAWWARPAAADAATTHRVDVTRAAYDPARVSVEAGDTVVWRWRQDGGSVTAADGSFDSHPDCSRLRPYACGREGDTFEFTFHEPGTYAYGANGPFTVAEGQVVVTAATEEPSPTPTSTDSPAPSPTDTESDEPSPTPTSTADPDPEPSPGEDTDAPSPPPPAPPDPDPGPPPPPETADPVTVDTDTPAPSPSPTTEDPAVATQESSPRPVPVPSFDSFPDARDPESDAASDVDGAVAIDAGGDDRDRTLWGVVGGVTVLGTLGALGRRVLFAEPWDGPEAG